MPGSRATQLAASATKLVFEDLESSGPGGNCSVALCVQDRWRSKSVGMTYLSLFGAKNHFLSNSFESYLEIESLGA